MAWTSLPAGVKPRWRFIPTWFWQVSLESVTFLPLKYKGSEKNGHVIRMIFVSQFFFFELLYKKNETIKNTSDVSFMQVKQSPNLHWRIFLKYWIFGDISPDYVVKKHLQSKKNNNYFLLLYPSFTAAGPGARGWTTSWPVLLQSITESQTTILTCLKLTC